MLFRRRTLIPAVYPGSTSSIDAVIRPDKTVGPGCYRSSKEPTEFDKSDRDSSVVTDFKMALSISGY